MCQDRVCDIWISIHPYIHPSIHQTIDASIALFKIFSDVATLTTLHVLCENAAECVALQTLYGVPGFEASQQPLHRRVTWLLGRLLDQYASPLVKFIMDPWN